MLERVRSSIGPTVYKAAARGPLTVPARLALRGWGSKVVPVVSYSKATNRKGEVFGESTSTVCAPRSAFDEEGAEVRRRLRSRSSLHWHEINNCVVSAYSPAALTRSGVVLPQELTDNLQAHLTPSNSLFVMHDGICFARTPRSNLLEVNQAIHCGGAGASNYYHFSMECMPQVWLSGLQDSEFRDAPLILPSEARTVPQFSHWLDLFAEDRPKIYLGPGEYVRVRQLVRFDEVSYGPFNLPAGQWPNVDDYRNHDQAFRHYLAASRDLSLKSWSKGSGLERIFIVRPEVRRKYNQDVLVEMAEAHGFVCVSPELLELHDQALLFNSAKFIIGSSGAAWSNLVFCREGTKALSWLPEEYDGFCSFSTLAETVGVDLRFLWSAYSQPLFSTGDAYTFSYIVDPERFRLALTHMLDGYPG